MVPSAVLPLVMAIDAGAQTPSVVSKKVHEIAIGGEEGPRRETWKWRARACHGTELVRRAGRG